MGWKIYAAVGAVLLLLASVILASGGLPSLPEIGTGGMTGLFGAGIGAENGPVDVDAILDGSDLSVDTPAGSLIVTLQQPSSAVTVGGSLVDLSGRASVLLELTGWKGKITSSGTLSLEGTADEVKVDGIRITSLDKNYKLAFEGLGYSDLKVRGVDIPSIKLTPATGYLYLGGGKTTLRVEGEPLELSAFVGDITIDTSLRLDGTASKVSVSGKNQVSVQ